MWSLINANVLIAKSCVYIYDSALLTSQNIWKVDLRMWCNYIEIEIKTKNNTINALLSCRYKFAFISGGTIARILEPF